MSETLIALNRFGLGARLDEPERIADPRDWLRAQLADPPSRLTPPKGASAKALNSTLAAYRAAGDREGRNKVRKRLRVIANTEARAALDERVQSERPFVERLVAFWSNHLCISTAKSVLVTSLAGSYEREAIRPHVLGRFEEMVLASARHPAMLLYLDNHVSVGPNSPGANPAKGKARRRGLNENYARELLELHTLGVDGGYSQEDVIELARVLTGWRVAWPGKPRGGGNRQVRGSVRFAFRPNLHEPGTKQLLGARVRGKGKAEGEWAIRTLCAHPSTARFVAHKLVAHFVADDPPQAAVERVEQTFRRTDGDLRAVAEELVELPEAWSSDTRKFRTPQDWMVAVFRALEPEMADRVAKPMIGQLRKLRHPLWSPSSPAGFGDTTQGWSDPDSLLNRAELGRSLARRLDAKGLNPLRLLEVMSVRPTDPLRSLLADRSIAPRERFALAVAGPAFQWR